MQEENKKQDIDKLRTILDNPYNTTISTKDNYILETVKRRLTKPYPTIDKTIHKKNTPDSLEPTVTIHGPLIKQTSTIPTIQKATIAEQKIIENKKPRLQIKPEDLYEIEKIETTTVNKEEQLEWIPVEEETTPDATPQIKTTLTPEEKQPAIPSETIKEEPSWEEIKEDTNIKTEIQPTVQKKETTTITEQQPETINVFKDITVIDQETAVKLYNQGITSTIQLKDYKVKDLVKIGIDKKTAKRIIKETKKINKKIEEKNSTGEEQPTETIPTIEESITKEIELKKEKIIPTDEWTPIQQNRKNKTTTMKIPDTDWEPTKTEETASSIQPYKHGEYTLYKKEITTPDGKKRVIHFFSKQKPLDSEPTDIPSGFEVKINKKTGLPYLKKRV
ncbi:MAG: helix-hairpin-helix domain-containing protein [Candidatus Thermoplasmatota archaeon]